MKKAVKKLEVVEQPLRLDLGCGKNKRDGFFGVDSRKFEGVDLVHDLSKKWPWADGSVEEAHCSHFIEHLTAQERIHFVNELYRVLKPGAKTTIIVPHWNSSRAYGDLTHQWPPVSEFWFYYLNKDWRAVNAPHNDFYTCDFDIVAWYNIHPAMTSRNAEYQQFAIAWYKEACQDMCATFTKK